MNNIKVDRIFYFNLQLSGFVRRHRRLRDGSIGSRGDDDDDATNSPPPPLPPLARYGWK